MFGANTNNVIYYKYKIVRIDILIPGKDTITVSYNNIGGIIIEKDFDNCIHPIFEIKLALHPIDIYDILDNKDTVKFNIRLDKYAFSSENDNEYLYRDLSFNETFTIYMDDNTVQMDKELYKKTKEVKGNRVDIDDISETYSFFLFKEKDIDFSKINIENDFSRNFFQSLQKTRDGFVFSRFTNFRASSTIHLMSFKPDNSWFLLAQVITCFIEST